MTLALTLTLAATLFGCDDTSSVLSPTATLLPTVTPTPSSTPTPNPERQALVALHEATNGPHWKVHDRLERSLNLLLVRRDLCRWVCHYPMSIGVAKFSKVIIIASKWPANVYFYPRPYPGGS